MKEDKKETVEKEVEEVTQKPTEKSRKARHSNPSEEDFKPRVKEDKDTSCPSLEELDEMPLKTYEDYLAYNKLVRKRRRALRKRDVEFLYCPIDLVPRRKVKLTRTSNRGLPININMRKLEHAVWFKSPKHGFKDGETVEIPECLIDKINDLSEPVYKQVKYPDGSHSTVLDYMDNKYSCQILMGD